jgi:hypothetical protein
MTFDIEATDTTGKLWKYSATVKDEDGKVIARYSGLGITQLRKNLKAHQKGQTSFAV